MPNDIKVTFEYDNKIVRDPIEFGVFSPGQESGEFDLIIKHNSNKAIDDCKFYISPYDKIYDGSNSPKEDFDRTYWFADNYTDHGISVYQEYEVFGEIFEQESRRMIDLDRTENVDIFVGSEVEILTGPISGEKVAVESYDPSSNLFTLISDFSIPVKGENYKINVVKTDFVKTQSGTSAEYPIRLLYKGGRIDRFDSAKIKLKVKVPPYTRSAGISHLNFNIQFTPEE